MEGPAPHLQAVFSAVPASARITGLLPWWGVSGGVVEGSPKGSTASLRLRSVARSLAGRARYAQLCPNCDSRAKKSVMAIAPSGGARFHACFPITGPRS